MAASVGNQSHAQTDLDLNYHDYLTSIRELNHKLEYMSALFGCPKAPKLDAVTTKARQVVIYETRQFIGESVNGMTADDLVNRSIRISQLQQEIDDAFK